MTDQQRAGLFEFVWFLINIDRDKGEITSTTPRQMVFVWSPW
jgi:hypothetical protein